MGFLLDFHKHSRSDSPSLSDILTTGVINILSTI